MYCCPKGKWQPGKYVYRVKDGKRRRTRGRCAVGMKTHTMLITAKGARRTRCKPGERRVRK
jgi:hypothetical protein